MIKGGVIPAQAGVQFVHLWIPAFAGMTSACNLVND